MNKTVAQFFLAMILPSISYAYVEFNNDLINDRYQHPFYAGLSYGYGSTTWEYLVPEENNLALALSTPTKSSEGGVVWGGFVGYEIINTFALELSYQRYPNAAVEFDEYSFLNYEYDGLNEFTTKTEAVSLLGKFMLFIPHSFYRVFASAGIAEVHRADIVYNHWHLSPAFGLGVNTNINERVMAELGADYIAGDGISELDPAEHYIPFLWSLHFRLAYRF